MGAEEGATCPLPIRVGIVNNLGLKEVDIDFNFSLSESELESVLSDAAHDLGYKVERGEVFHDIALHFNHPNSRTHDKFELPDISSKRSQAFYLDRYVSKIMFWKRTKTSHLVATINEGPWGWSKYGFKLFYSKVDDVLKYGAQVYKRCKEKTGQELPFQFKACEAEPKS